MNETFRRTIKFMHKSAVAIVQIASSLLGN
jgi:hypothetical protein